MNNSNSRKRLWFGCIGRMRWVTTPNSGADTSPQSRGTDGTFLNGGGFVRNAWSSHKVYVYEWPDSSSVEDAALMEAYRSGVYGRGLIYFVDPLIYERNILPERWAAPSIAIGDEGAPMVYDTYPESIITSGGSSNDLPVQSAYYNLDSIASGYRNGGDNVFIPIPEGYTLYIGAMYQSTGDGGMFVTPVDAAGNNGTSVRMTEVENDASDIVPDTFNGGSGVRLWAGKDDSTNSSVTISGMIARLYPTGETPPATFSEGPWMPGMGHSGCRFVGNPTNIENSGVNGGHVGYAATFKEVGDWS